MHSSVLSAALVAAVMNSAFAQTFTDCNPTTSSNCPSDPALGKTVTVDFTKGASDQFTLAEGTTLTYDKTNGAQFKMSTEAQAPTISSNWYIMFGKVDIVMQAAPGTGIVSSLVLESDDLDEIDLEWLGGDFTQVESNYFGKGNTTSYTRAIYHPVTNPQTGMHKYTIDWDKDSIKWSIDGALVRTLAYADALGGQNYPQTPMRVKMGNWDGGSSTSPAGTVQWAGGLTDWSKGASYTMQVQSITIQDYTTTGSEYVWSDKTGSFGSIKAQGAPGGSDNTTDTSSSVSGAASASAAVSTSTGPDGSKTTHTGAPSSVKPLGAAPTAATTSAINPTASGASFVQSTGTTNPTTSSTSSTTSPTASNGASGVKPSKYGAIDIVVVGLGLALGYLVM